MCECFSACMNIYPICAWSSESSEEWSYRWFQARIWVLGSKSGSSIKAARALNLCTISTAQTLHLNIFAWMHTYKCIFFTSYKTVFFYMNSSNILMVIFISLLLCSTIPFPNPTKPFFPTSMNT